MLTEKQHIYTTTIMGYIRVILGLYRDNGKENGNYNYIGVVGVYHAGPGPSLYP